MVDPCQQSLELSTSDPSSLQWTHPNLFYRYRVLGTSSSFRLLHVERSSDEENAPFHYSLHETLFDQASPPTYEALSYVWGTSDRCELLRLRDGKFLRITKPLKEALAYVERQCETRRLWVDQICIDQDDRGERTHQVKLMGQIYSRCVRVLVWLGRMIAWEAGSSPSDAPEQKHSSERGSFSRMTAKRFGLRRLYKVAGSGETPAGSLYDEVLQSPWFQRAWIFQEIVLPPSALLIFASAATKIPGKAHTISLVDLFVIADANDDRRGKSLSGITTSTTISFMLRRHDEQHKSAEYARSTIEPIEQTLSHLAPRARTSEDVDRLYAFFGLNGDPNVSLTPSYDCSLETAMISTATCIIEGTCSLDIFEVLPRAVGRRMQHIAMPTWTPDFREDHLVVPFNRSRKDSRHVAKEHPDLLPVFISSTYTYYRGTIYCAGEEKRTIQAHGFVLDHVEFDLGTVPPKTASDAYLDALLKRSIKAWNKASASKHKHKATGLATNTTELGFAPSPTEATLREALIAENCCSDQRILNHEVDFIGAAQQVMHGRNLWMTRSGRFVCGSHLRSGDHICLAYGCSNPIALRGHDEVTTVLGTCYLQGWMDPWKTDKFKSMEEKNKCCVFHIV